MILLTGATGFTGRVVCDVLLDRGLPFRCLVRDPAKARSLVDRGVPCVPGDVRDEGAIRQALEGCSGVINLVEFNQEHVALLLREARRAGVRRALFMSAPAIFTRLDAPSKALRERTENTAGRAFNLSGKNALTYRESVREVARLLEKRIWMVSLPPRVAILAAEISRRIPGLPKISGEQVERLNEDKAFSHEEASEAWGFDPMDFSTGIRMELEDLGLLGR